MENKIWNAVEGFDPNDSLICYRKTEKNADGTARLMDTLYMPLRAMHEWFLRCHPDGSVLIDKEFTKDNGIHAAAAGDDMRTQVLQPLALGNGQVAGYDQDAGVPRCGTADGQCRAEAAGAGLHHRHAGLQRAALGGKGEHRLGQAVLRGAGCPAEIEIG